MNNQVIRQAAKTARIPLWKIAESLGIADSALSRKLRHELPDEEKQHILAIINELKQAS